MTEFSSNPVETLTPQNRQMLVSAIEDKLITEYREGRYTEELRAYASGFILEGTPQQASCAADIILTNTLHGNPVPDIMGTYNFVDEYNKKQQLIGLAIEEPELARAIVANNIAGFHASNSSSLLGVLEHGLLSSRESRNRGIALGSGERTYTNHKAHPFISFADWRDPYTISEYANGGVEFPTSRDMYAKSIRTLLNEAEESEKSWGPDHPFAVNARLVAEDNKRLVQELNHKPDSLLSRLVTANFPIAYGIDISSYDRVRSSLEVAKNSSEKLIADCMAQSQYGSEFAVFDDTVPPEDIPVIAVPAARVEMVRQLVGEAGRGIDVYPLEPLLVAHGKPPRQSY